ncbi:hypothetical protein BDF19DRAFT_429513 [Syncephalis fuscata]|nr:hypothetical protein BDF19DRAFT_429513 [Syncephalis fuscata]
MSLIYSALSRTALCTKSRYIPSALRAVSSLRYASNTTTTERRTALYDFHLEHGGEMVEFAGWSMPVKYTSLSVLKSHLHTRENASLFDVSHMLQSRLTGKDRVKFFERLVVADLQALPEGHGTLSVYTDEDGGIIDDLIVTNENNSLYIVSNAGCTEKDLKHVREQLDRFKSEVPGADVHLETLDDSSLLALQGPKAASVLEKLTGKGLADQAFMTARKMKVAGLDCHVARCGYTGEDGFEISVASRDAVALAEALVASSDVQLAGLGARDSLRLEAGMCLYGHDLDETITPIEAGLLWTIGKRRREEGGFLGAKRIQDQIKNGVSRRRVGLIVEGPPAREGAVILNSNNEPVGVVTSGCPSPSLKKNIAMGYVKKAYSKVGTELATIIRKNNRAAQVVKMPFVAPRYHKI